MHLACTLLQKIRTLFCVMIGVVIAIMHIALLNKQVCAYLRSYALTLRPDIGSWALPWTLAVGCVKISNLLMGSRTQCSNANYQGILIIDLCVRQGHALFTRQAGGLDPCPLVDFDGGFNAFMAAAYNLPPGVTVAARFGKPFDPFLNDQNYVLSVLTLEELGATGNKARTLYPKLVTSTLYHTLWPSGLETVLSLDELLRA